MYLKYTLVQRAGVSRSVFGPFEERGHRESAKNVLESNFCSGDHGDTIVIEFVSECPAAFNPIQPLQIPEFQALLQPY